MGGCVSVGGHDSRAGFPLDMDSAVESYRVRMAVGAGGRGRPVSCQLDVTDSEIVLRRGGHAPLRWPLKFLRRYGYDEGVFSFESGRRCVSGAGVFAFATDEAEEIFQTVQSRVQDGATGAHLSAAVARLRPVGARSSMAPRPHRSESAVENAYLQPLSASLYRASVSTQDLSSADDAPLGASSSPYRSLSLSDTDLRPTPDAHAYINVGVTEPPAPTAAPPAGDAPAACAKLPPRPPHSRHQSVDLARRPVGLLNGTKWSLPSSSSSSSAYVNKPTGRSLAPLDYVTLNVGSASGCATPNTPLSSARGSFSSACCSLDGGAPCRRHSDAPPVATYVAIDLDKTCALRDTARSSDWR